MKVAVLGAGAWGTAIAVHAGLRHSVSLWARDPAVSVALASQRENSRYLAGVFLAPAIAPTADLGAALAGADLLIIATPLSGLRTMARALSAASRSAPLAPVIWLCKGLEAQTMLLPHDVLQSEWPGVAGGVLSGPSFAQEVAAGLPAGLTVASTDDRVALAAIAALHHASLRIYRTDDVIGVEAAGALKNIMAIATGISDGLGLGMNARAALLTRGMAEMIRYGVAIGARPDTFMGLAGVGDLVLTCTGDLSRNRAVGLALARGEPLDAILAGLGHVAEGVACCRAVRDSARKAGVELPITEAVAAVLFDGSGPRDAVAALLAREPRAETIHTVRP
ncbi:MAG: NAD(P)H-dependent glycerol-3-phosphate dehydrogenase [Burkholderiales bacterium]